MEEELTVDRMEWSMQDCMYGNGMELNGPEDWQA